MENKDYVTYEYATKSVKAKDQTRAIDLYEAFGWEVTGTTSSLTDGVTLSLKRDRKLKHKQELNRLERKAEEISGVIRNLEASKKRGGDIFAYAFGCFAALVLGGGMCHLIIYNVWNKRLKPFTPLLSLCFFSPNREFFE